MALCEDIIFSDPVLQRVFFDRQRLAPTPGHDAIVHIAMHEVAQLEVLFLKAKAVETAERVAWLKDRIRSNEKATGYLADRLNCHIDSHR